MSEEHVGSNQETGFIEEQVELLFLAPEKIINSKLNDFEVDCDIDMLIESIRYFGLLQPLNVYPNDDGTYLLIAGARRLYAIQKGIERGMKWFSKGIPCYCSKDTTKRLDSLDEQIKIYEANIQSRDRTGNYLEKVKTLYSLYQKKLERDDDFTTNLMEYMSQKLGVGKRQVQKITHIIKNADHWLCNAIEDGNMAWDKASMIIRLDKDDQDALREIYEKEGSLSTKLIESYKNNDSQNMEDNKNSGEDKNTVTEKPKESDIMEPDEAFLKVFADPVYDEAMYEDYDPENGLISEKYMQTDYSFDDEFEHHDMNTEMNSGGTSMDAEEEVMMKSSILFKRIEERGDCNDYEKIYVDRIIKSAAKFYFPKFVKQGYIDDFMLDTIREIVNAMIPLLKKR